MNAAIGGEFSGYLLDPGPQQAFSLFLVTSRVIYEADRYECEGVMKPSHICSSLRFSLLLRLIDHRVLIRLCAHFG